VIACWSAQVYVVSSYSNWTFELKITADVTDIIVSVWQLPATCDHATIQSFACANFYVGSAAHATKNHRWARSRQRMVSELVYNGPVLKRIQIGRNDVLASFVPTALAGKEKAIVKVRLSVHLFPLYLFNRLIFELAFLCVGVMGVGLKVKVIGQGQRSTPIAYGRGNAVTRSVWLRSLIEDIFYSFSIR